MKMCAYCRSMHDLKRCPNCGSTLAVAAPTAIDYQALAMVIYLGVVLNTRR